MNAILQCLSYTDILAEYLVLDQYKSDLKRKRRLQAITAPLTKGEDRFLMIVLRLNMKIYGFDLKRKYSFLQIGRNGGMSMGSKGEVTEQLATMLKSLWSLQYDPEISIRFKSLVDKHASQYKGGRQHDAQEFLLWLLDQVHFSYFEKKILSSFHGNWYFVYKSKAPTTYYYIF